MKHNNEKTIERIRGIASIIAYDANNINEELRLDIPYEELEQLWRVCEIISSHAENAKELISKMLDERDDMEAEDEGE